MSAEDVAAAFINHYYTTFDTNPAALAGLYQPQSSVTFEGKQLSGVQQIVEKYVSLGPVAHNIPALVKDVQMSTSGSAMIIMVSGQLRIGSDNPLQFAQVFQLVATGPGAYYVHNDVLRLIYA